MTPCGGFRGRHWHRSRPGARGGPGPGSWSGARGPAGFARFRSWERRWAQPGGGVYRSRRGVILGVCRGIADRFDLSVFWVRVVALGVFVMSGFWPVGVLYILAALVMKPAPAIRPETEEEREFYESYVESPNVAARSLKKRYSDLERRLQRMEDVVTDRDFEWRRHMDG